MFEPSPGREVSTKALLARSLIWHYLHTFTWRDGMGIGTTELQLCTESAMRLLMETSKIRHIGFFLLYIFKLWDYILS